MEDSALVEHKGGLSREANKSADSTFDRIYKYFHSKSRVELTRKEMETMERWEKAWLLLIRHRTPYAVSQILTKLFNISRSVAFDDVRNAMNLFSDPREDMKTARRAIAEEGILKGADKAWKTGDLEAHQKYMKQYIELHGLKAEDTDKNMAELVKNFKATQIIINFNKNDVDTEIEKLRGKVLDITHEEGE